MPICLVRTENIGNWINRKGIQESIEISQLSKKVLIIILLVYETHTFNKKTLIAFTLNILTST